MSAAVTAARTALVVGLDRTIRLSEFPVRADQPESFHAAVLGLLGDAEADCFPIGSAPGLACLVVGAGHQDSDLPVNDLAGDIATHYGSGGPRILRGPALIVGGSPSASVGLSESAALDLAQMVMFTIRMATGNGRSAVIVPLTG